MLELLRKRRHRLLEPQLSRQLGHVPHHEPLMMPQHVHELIGAFLHTGQCHENAAAFFDRGRGDEQIQQHFDAVLTRAPQHEQGILAIGGVIRDLRDHFQQRLAVHALQRDRILPAPRGVRHLLLRVHDAGQDRQRL